MYTRISNNKTNVLLEKQFRDERSENGVNHSITASTVIENDGQKKKPLNETMLTT